MYVVFTYSDLRLKVRPFCVPQLQLAGNAWGSTDRCRLFCNFWGTLADPTLQARCLVSWRNTRLGRHFLCFLSLLQVDFYQETCTCSISMLWRSMSIYLLEAVEALSKLFLPAVPHNKTRPFLDSRHQLLGGIHMNPCTVASPALCMCRNLCGWFDW